jgi:hypothetical protein
MRELFGNLEIWKFENEGKNSASNQSEKLELMGRPEQMELAQFGRVLHDWRPKGKQKKIKQEENK